MERNRTIVEHERALERQDNKYSAEQAVTKHFEESLRRAKEKVLKINIIKLRTFQSSKSSHNIYWM